MSTFVFPTDLEERLSDTKVTAMVTIDRPDDAIPLGKALLACGIKAIEVSFQSKAASEAIAKLRANVPECLVGAAGVVFEDQLRQAKEAGASYGSSFGTDRAVIEAADHLNFPFIPGVMTPSEIQSAVSLGCRHLHLFPMEPIGGIDYFRSIRDAYSHLGVKFMIGGGMSLMHLRRYLSHDDVLCIAGEWIAPRRIIQNQNWSAVIDNATEVTSILKDLSSKQ
ncbi:bifunctional 4-hydroxy-2-oxoglutarate aldolase/2-dehydro-3-deoxy-phosphogluconate aldolase [Rubripirellula amarantea]|uniref:Putative KHG/KDPG aldolase n=1 Tax=Rubripirellula amarantea TaxID=2527999 RepID=A0A5C5WU77_9BACT|nr:bifunctional 4-hydroxy-2-oxoglutarate aldolase/2-dehydro-3-deoxy-phosphogluconate aldolase [Rubripirellula amarantea]MDA8745599.1 bifunctional 4-hydroxy-2-oxoglutarate aldolase/2-dehydro-3-deoxy-phosphogluconate aldolase [Rubripirellula amarantea]TWT54138.1 putative KHG/KDPG aldolase [Rubripirellula amarantea]